MVYTWLQSQMLVSATHKWPLIVYDMENTSYTMATLETQGSIQGGSDIGSTIKTYQS